MSSTNQPAISPIYRSVSETCRVWGIGKTSLYGAVKRGDVEARKWGRKTLIRQSTVSAYLENRCPVLGGEG